ncbi:hypothetical protein GGS24DRAFT_510589 [Hypoxylon argillaceum]|nr:hypothetical protein GGS24DRAFT_510589 [Hypoxylon argillaceum]
MASEVVITHQICANSLVCDNPGNKACSGCHIVVYCSKVCQSMDWPIHRTRCHSVVTKATFEKEGRLPVWARRTLYADLMRKHYNIAAQYSPQIGPSNFRPLLEKKNKIGHFGLFGCYPAIDVLQLARNEGVERTEPIDILFTEPDDLRDVIKTILDLPNNMTAPINVFITDDNAAKTTRNLLLLLMALSSRNPRITAECAVHFWYSRFIPKWCKPAIQELLGSFIADCEPKDQEEKNTLKLIGMKRRWDFGSASLDVVLTPDKQGESANVDNYEEVLLSSPPQWRTVKGRYIPSAQVTAFQSHFSPSNWPLDLNPGLFYIGFSSLEPDVDPLRGWDLATINNFCDMKGACNDIYGKMFYYVRELFRRFIVKLRTLVISFYVLPYKGIRVPREISQQFDRIETGRLADSEETGIRRVVEVLSPLLKDPKVNPHATMITFHPVVFEKIRNAFPCPKCDPDRAARVKAAVDLTPEERSLLDAYLPLEASDTAQVNWIFTMAGWHRRQARWLFRDPAQAWALYREVHEFADVAHGARVAAKAAHTVVPEWILRLEGGAGARLGPDGFPTPEARWDFDALLARRQTAGYRYVEWRRLGEKSMARRGKRGKEAERRHDKSHEKLTDAERAALRAKGAQLERWMGRDNCANWTPY